VTALAAEPEDLLSLLRSAGPPLEIRRFAARGLLPLEPADQLRALLLVLEDPDPQVRASAGATFAAVPPEELILFLARGSPGEMEIHRIAAHSEDPYVLERVVSTRNVADETLEMLARAVRGPAQDALVSNQVRLLRKPGLIDALFENPELTADARRRLNEVREEFFDKETRRQEAERARREEEARRALEESEAAAAATDEAAQTEAAETDAEVAEDSTAMAAIYRRISVMTVSEKISLAYSGGKEERRILIGDSNRLVGLAVLKARGLTVNEIESFCSMRHLDDEIFRKIALNRDWMRQPLIITAMVKNPKVPIAISLPLVKHLPLRELKSIVRDPNLPEGLRITARKRLEEKRR
jgi:hypothetical protein